MSTVPAQATWRPRGAAIAVLSPRLMGPRLVDLLGPDGAPDSPRCHVLDAKHDLDEGWVVLYELEGRLVLGIAGDSREDDGLQAFAFPDDPVLTGLAAALDAEEMRTILADVLPGMHRRDARILRCRITPLRYRPLRRCTLKVEVALQERRSGAIHRLVLFAKLYHEVEKARAVYAEMTALHAASGLHGVALAPPVAFATDLAMVLQGAVPGQPLDAFMATVCRHPRRGVWRVEDALASAAAALAALHAARLPSGRPRHIGPRVERMARRAIQVQRIDPALGRRMGALAETARDTLVDVSPPAGELRLVHGDCKPSQFLMNGSDMGLIDFDHSGRADPACDVGDFLASLRKLALGRHVSLYGRARLRRLEGNFLTAYQADTEPAPRFEDRVRWYQCVALQRKAFRAFQRSPRSPLPKMLIDEAERCGIDRLPAGRR